MSNPFKKIVQNTTDVQNPRYEEHKTTASKVSTRACKNCKAPRPADTNLTTCDYCDFAFMDIHAEIKSDN